MAAPFDRPPWFYTDFGLAVADPRLAEVFRHWQAIRDGRDVPLAERLDPLDLAPRLGDLFVVRVEDGAGAAAPPSFTYTLIGTRLVEAVGRDATGRPVADTFPPEHPVVLVYQQVVARRVPARTHGRLDWVDRNYRRFESLMLPLAGADGGIVKVLGAAVYEPCDGSIVGDGAPA